MVEEAINGKLTIDLSKEGHADLIMVEPLTGVIVEAQKISAKKHTKFPNVLKRMVLYLLDIMYGEFDPLP